MPSHSAPSGRRTPAGPLARLVLSDGTILRGTAFGATNRGIVVQAEVVFNTAITGYQEALTDPSYSGQILVMTAPLIGNTGTNPSDVESGRIQVSGFVVRELARRHSNYRATEGLHEYLARQGVLAIAGIDTRALTRRLRTQGVTPGVMTDDATMTDASLVSLAKKATTMDGQNLVPAVGCTSSEKWSEDLGAWGSEAAPSRALRVAALDCGAKRNILRHLTERGCVVTLLPHDTGASAIKAMYAKGEIDGLFVSNGPGDPAAVHQTIDTLRSVIEEPGEQCIPTFGICLGHQLLALAAGGTTFKLRFGHRGINQPVVDQRTGRVEITSQNHGFAVDPASIEAVGGVATHINLNDGTLAGFRMAERPVFSVQYHPESSPGPHDSGYLFDEFVELMATRRDQSVVR